MSFELIHIKAYRFLNMSTAVKTVFSTQDQTFQSDLSRPPTNDRSLL